MIVLACPHAKALLGIRSVQHLLILIACPKVSADAFIKFYKYVWVVFPPARFAMFGGVSEKYLEIFPDGFCTRFQMILQILLRGLSEDWVFNFKQAPFPQKSSLIVFFRVGYGLLRSTRTLLS